MGRDESSDGRIEEVIENREELVIVINRLLWRKK